MNKYLIIPLCILAVAAIAAPVTGPNGEWLGEEGWPTEIGGWKNPNRDIAKAEGYHYSTASELAKWAAEDKKAADLAQAEAAAAEEDARAEKDRVDAKKATIAKALKDAVTADKGGDEKAFREAVILWMEAQP
ncbi:MAG TPA: hypothetical protein PLL10_11200 [Elusimicrobiales bacterium]|nr:hypothetical protein [Elusimicrobiales bacterium]